MLENGRKLFVTLHIRNVTMEDDSAVGALGRYECHAYAVGDPVARGHGFSVNVIRRKYHDVHNWYFFGRLSIPNKDIKYEFTKYLPALTHGPDVSKRSPLCRFKIRR